MWLIIYCAVGSRDAALNKHKWLPSYSLQSEGQTDNKLMNKYLSGGGNCYRGKENRVQEIENAEKREWLICMGVVKGKHWIRPGDIWAEIWMKDYKLCLDLDIDYLGWKRRFIGYEVEANKTHE